MEPHQHIVSIDHEIELHSTNNVKIEAGEGSSSHDRPATARDSIDHEIELHSTNNVKIEAGEGSSSHDRPATSREERIKWLVGALCHDRAIITRKERIKMLMKAGAGTKEAKIQNVIFFLQDHKHSVNYFEPRVASFGPIHHGKSQYDQGEKYKLMLASEFIHEKKLDEKINNLFEKIKKHIKKLRECFEENVTKKYDDESLAWMLFVDGYAILQYISCGALAANDKFEELNIKNYNVIPQQDLFLLENQVPYHLLKLLISLSGKEAQLSELSESYIRNVCCLPREQQKRGERDPTHLLDLLRTRLLGPPRSSRKIFRWPFRKIRGEEHSDWALYRNVQELQAAGIQLKCSENSYLRNIRFSRRFGLYPGYLCLPPISVNDSTGPMFMNLIAYEMCRDFKNDLGITSYISFLVSLIDEPNDVKHLRKARVLKHFLGSDQQVAELFHEIGTNLVPNVEAYKDVKCQIQDYYDNWMVEVVNKSFSNPMSLVTFLGTIVFALALSSIQTWYTVFPSPGPCDDVCKLKLD